MNLKSKIEMYKAIENDITTSQKNVSIRERDFKVQKKKQQQK